jgi:hypothetical protein
MRGSFALRGITHCVFRPRIVDRRSGHHPGQVEGQAGEREVGLYHGACRSSVGRKAGGKRRRRDRRAALVAILGTFLAFGVTHLISNVPGLRVILGSTSAGNGVLDHSRASTPQPCDLSIRDASNF